MLKQINKKIKALDLCDVFWINLQVLGCRSLRKILKLMKIIIYFNFHDLNCETLSVTKKKFMKRQNFPGSAFSFPPWRLGACSAFSVSFRINFSCYLVAWTKSTAHSWPFSEFGVRKCGSLHRTKVLLKHWCFSCEHREKHWFDHINGRFSQFMISRISPKHSNFEILEKQASLTKKNIRILIIWKLRKIFRAIFHTASGPSNLNLATMHRKGQPFVFLSNQASIIFVRQLQKFRN